MENSNILLVAFSDCLYFSKPPPLHVPFSLLLKQQLVLAVFFAHSPDLLSKYHFLKKY
jgi:hypothetical protein